MRFAVCTLSAVLLSGCSWLGYGGGYGGGGNSYGVGTSCGNTGAYGSQYSQANSAGGTYGVSTCGGAASYGYNASSGYGMAGANGYGAGTVLGSAAPYGAAAGGQYASMNGQWAARSTTSFGGNYGGGNNASGNVTTVQGAPIYVPQPYPAYYGGAVASGGCGNTSNACGGLRGGYSANVQQSYPAYYGGGVASGGCGSVSYACGGLRGGYSALPFGIEAGIGTDIAIGGDIVGDKPGGPALGGAPGATLNTSGSNAISYGDAYKNAVNYDLAATYDINPSTTILGRLGYSKAEGERIRTGTIDDSTFVPAPATVTTEDLYAEWSDLEQWTVEGGVRKYMGGWNNTVSGLRPYVQATAGFSHNNAVSLSQDSATLMPAGSNVQPYIDAGWIPTASGAIGAEMQVGPRTAIGVEAGIRWRDDLNTITQSDDRWSVPVRLRARVSF
jgi:hypothetical protein